MGRFLRRPKQRGDMRQHTISARPASVRRTCFFCVNNRRRDAAATPKSTAGTPPPHLKTIMETRVALIGIIVEEPDSVGPLNELLHEYRQYIIGRMGIPYKPRNISVISVTLDAPQDVISSLSGKLGMLKGVTSKALMAKL